MSLANLARLLRSSAAAGRQPGPVGCPAARNAFAGWALSKAAQPNLRVRMAERGCDWKVKAL